MTPAKSEKPDYSVNAMQRGIVNFALDSRYNDGLELAAQMVDLAMKSPNAYERYMLARKIRDQKKSAVSHLAEAKVGSGKLAGLLAPLNLDVAT